MSSFQLIRELEKKLEQLEQKVKFLEAENLRLRQENIALKDKLDLNSKNSSIPSSKELFKLKKKSKVSNRKIGGQIGHVGSNRKKMQADKIVAVPLKSTTCDCGHQISLSSKPYIHQRIDIPEIKPYVVEYQLAHGRCKKRKKRKAAEMPVDAGNDIFGPRTKSVMSALTGFYKNSKREVKNIMNDIFNLDISLGSVSNSEEKVSECCKNNYETIDQLLSYETLLHIDETSHYNKGKLGWC